MGRANPELNVIQLMLDGTGSSMPLVSKDPPRYCLDTWTAQHRSIHDHFAQVHLSSRPTELFLLIAYEANTA